MTKTERLASELIALPSVNPAFVPPGDERAGEECVADFLASVAARSGLDVEFQKVLPGRPNLLARLVPAGKVRQRVLLAPHLDTVIAEEAGFIPRAKHGRLYGRGACDTKGSVAAMMTALCEIAALKERPCETEIVFAGLVDEENAQAGSRALAASGLQADLAIVGEPTQLKAVTAHKGCVWLRLEVRGKSAHASLPQLGHSAIRDMARVVAALETDYAAGLKKKSHRLLGPGTVSVGTIQGGTQPNIVPQSCVISIDRRTLPGETEAGVRREITALLRRHRLRASLGSSKAAACLPLETKENLPQVRDFLRSIGQRIPIGVHFFCDAAVLGGAGIPSVVFGPGNIAQAHTADEWISLKSLERAKSLLVNYLKSLP